MPDAGGGFFTAFMAAKDAGKGLNHKGGDGEPGEGEEEPEPGAQGQGDQYQQGYDDGFRDARNEGGGFKQPSGGGWGS